MQLNERDFSEFQQTSLLRLEEIEQQITLDENGQILSIPSNKSILFLSYFYMPKTPWVTDKLYMKAGDILSHMPKDRLDELEISKLIILEFSSLPPLDKTSFNRRSKNIRNKEKMLSKVSKAGLIPHLGYSSFLDSRNKWKNESIYAISSLYWFLKLFVYDEKSLRAHSTFVTSAILNIMDFSDFNIKILSCAVLNVLLDSIENRDNYLVKSGLYLEFMDTISVGFLYLPPTLSTLESCVPLLDICFDTYLNVIEKCFDDNESKVDIFTELISDQIFDKCSMSVFTLDQSSKILILNVYLKYIIKIMDALLRYNKNAIYLMVRDFLRKLLLNILIDSFLFINSINILYCEAGATSNLEFIYTVLDLLIKVIEATPQRIQNYKFDILTAIILFAERFEMELLTDYTDSKSMRNNAKILELEEPTIDIENLKLKKENKHARPTNEEITKISQCIKKVMQLILGNSENRELQEEIIHKKPIMKKYII